MCRRFRRFSTRAFWKCILHRARAQQASEQRGPRDLRRPHYPNEDVTFEKRVTILAGSERPYELSSNRKFSLGNAVRECGRSGR